MSSAEAYEDLITAAHGLDKLNGKDGPLLPWIYYLRAYNRWIEAIRAEEGREHG